MEFGTREPCLSMTSGRLLPPVPRKDGERLWLPTSLGPEMPLHKDSERELISKWYALPSEVYSDIKTHLYHKPDPSRSSIRAISSQRQTSQLDDRFHRRVRRLWSQECRTIRTRHSPKKRTLPTRICSATSRPSSRARQGRASKTSRNRLDTGYFCRKGISWCCYYHRWSC
jgi:hypothetical protein